ncbi:MAG: glycosyltransferase [Candidatus Binatia bacterium]
MRNLAITLCQGTWSRFRGNIMRAVTLVLEEAGHRVTQVSDGPLDLRADGVVWMLGNVNRFPLICRQLTSTPRSERPFVLLWHTELLPPPKGAGLPWPRLHVREIVAILRRKVYATDVYTNYFRLCALARKGLPDLLLAPTLDRYEFLIERDISAYWAPLGYDPSRGYDMGLPRDIDVLFLGTLDIPRRKRIIKHLRRGGVDLLTMGSRFDPTCWGEDRTRLLNRTKIFLNISRGPGQLPDTRLILGMANRALVISEPIYNPAPYVPGKHYISAAIEDLPEMIAYYLTHDYERERIANEGHRLVTQEVTMARSVSRILELVREQLHQKQLARLCGAHQQEFSWEGRKDLC